MLKETTLYSVQQKTVLTGGVKDFYGIATLGSRDRALPVKNHPDPRQFIYDPEETVKVEYYPVEYFHKYGKDYFYILGPGIREIIDLREREYKEKIKCLKEELLQTRIKIENMGFWQRLKWVFGGKDGNRL